ncbi:hypothetical protein [Virgisporangium aurantiacum]|uniref:Uncharacterized protein n=1 Tax=Virgisporangium aurantiacum TaxID=175570 RepID=A0A8J3Z829_9ACTN|nr:hypothetical protein [Virgisporangium aurantiacum]GIJ57045.1 hypothetical protein Vau01_045610 [Virgisporangium aurantiacum]
MTTATCVKKAVVVATLRSRDLHGRADWVDKEFAQLIDTTNNAGLLQTLGIDLDTLADDAWAGPAATDPEID